MAANTEPLMNWIAFESSTNIVIPGVRQHASAELDDDKLDSISPTNDIASPPPKPLLPIKPGAAAIKGDTAEDDSNAALSTTQNYLWDASRSP